MPGTTTDLARVAPFESYGRDLVWADTGKSTGVFLVSRVAEQATRIMRGGRGYLTVDLHAARRFMAPVMLSGNISPIAYLGVPDPDISPVQVTDPTWRDGLNRWSSRWTEFPNYETALVALAYDHLR